MKKIKMMGESMFSLHLKKWLLMAKLTTFFILLGLLQVSASSYSQTGKFHFKIRNATILDVFKQIEEESTFRFFYDNEQVDLTRKVSIDAEKKDISEILNFLFEETELTYEMMDNLILVKSKIDKQGFLKQSSQQKGITGKVIDSSGQPLIGVTVVLKGTTKGTITNADGAYSLTDLPDNAVLQFSFIGMKIQEVSVGNKTSINVTMEEETIGIGEVVAVGYGTLQKSDLTGAITSVKSRDFNQGVTASPEQLIQGKVAGVSITQNSGEPGAQQTILIRGAGSLRSGNGPLYVIDGVPLNSTTISSADVGFGSTSGINPLVFLNTADIESMDILKDASATAIYGSRAANGVILITTKKGDSGFSGVNYSSSVGISSVANKIDLLSADEFRDFQNDRGSSDYIYSSDLNTDWQDVLFRQAIVQNHSVSLNGGNKQSDYYVSVGVLDQEGIVLTSELKRYSGRANLNQRLLDDRVKIGINMSIGHIDNTGAPRTDNADANYGSLMSDILNANPTYPVYDDDGDLYVFPDSRNPMADIEVFDDYSRTDRILGNIDASFEIIKNLEYKINFGIERTNANRESQISMNTLANMEFPDGYCAFMHSEVNSKLIENSVKYNVDFSEHKIGVLLGHSYQRVFSRSTTFAVEDFSTDEYNTYYNPSNGSTKEASSGGASINELQSFFGRLNYNYNSKYLLTATLRADGSSKFGKNNRYGYFPSAAASWNISQEEFIKSISVIDNLKLRLGWGMTGNEGIPSQITKASLSASSDPAGGAYYLGDELIPGYVYSRTANPDIKWEVTTQTNVGLDFMLFGGLSGTVDYFYKNTTDMLLNLTVTDPISPTSSYWSNVDMDVINSGIEVSLDYMSKRKKDMSWSVGGNFSFLHNEVKNAPFSYLGTGSVQGPGQTGATCGGMLNGYALSSFYMYKFLGFDENGESIFYDKTGEGDITSDDRVVVGSPFPTFRYNLHGSFSYKQFDFNINFTGVSGNKIFNNTALAYFNMPQLASGLNIAKDKLSADESLTNSAAVSSRYVEDGSYFRLNDATIRYNIKIKDAPWLKGLSVFVTGQNLFTITKYTGYDPEVNVPSGSGLACYGVDFDNYPKARTFTTGVNLSF